MGNWQKPSPANVSDYIVSIIARNAILAENDSLNTPQIGKRS
jgi:hypothetical protein